MPNDPEETKSEKPTVRLAAEEVVDEVQDADDARMSQASTPVSDEPKQPETWSKFPPQIDSTRTQVRQGTSKLTVVVIIILVAATVAISGMAYKKFMGTKDVSSESITAALPTPTDTPEPSPSPTPEVTSKLDVDIQVLNGSGVTGQAGLVAGSLEKLGFPAPDAGNYDGDEVSVTQVLYSVKVDRAIVDEIVEELEKTFDSVEAELDEDLTDYHVQVITGTDE